jgi:hypothetical protein
MGYCIVCKERWTGMNRAHCTGCHRTFNSVGGFDKHRKDLKCLDPESIGMEMNEKGIWSTPMNEELKKRLGYASRMPFLTIR